MFCLLSAVVQCCMHPMVPDGEGGGSGWWLWSAGQEDKVAFFDFFDSGEAFKCILVLS